MSGPHPELRREQRTMLMTLRMHARDARASRPILGDRFAEGVLDAVGEGLGRGTGLDGNLPVVCARAAQIDAWATAFLRDHPDAVVAHLGCGLDSRVLRLAPPSGVDWLDVDQRPVIELRRAVYQPRPGVRTLAVDVTDAAWWSEVPVDRPLLVIAEGLLMYLPPDAARRLVRRALDDAVPDRPRLLLADTVAPWVRRVAGLQPEMRRAGTAFSSSTLDVEQAMAASSGEAETVGLPALAARGTPGLFGLLLGIIARAPGGARSMVLHRAGLR